MTDTIRFECVTCGAILPSFNEYDAHITAHLRAQSAPLRTLRRKVRSNKIMIASMETQNATHNEICAQDGNARRPIGTGLSSFARR